MFISTYYESSGTNQKKRKAKKTILKIIFFALLVALFIFVIWPKLIYGNMSTGVLYSPEILQTYIANDDGYYKIDEGETIISFIECTKTGEVTAVFEHFDEEGNVKWKVNLIGSIVKKRNNGKITINWTKNEIDVGRKYNWNDITSTTIKRDAEKLILKYSDYKYKYDADTENKYSILSTADFKKLENSDRTYRLKRNITIRQDNWTPIEDFSGTLIGNGYSIKNLTIDSSSSNVGFFSTLSGKVYNLNFEDASVTVSGSNQNIGILCGVLEGQISNITVSGNINAPNSIHVGGVIGFAEITSKSYTMKNLTNKANITGNNYVGGIIGNSIGGNINQTLEFSTMHNEGSVNGAEYVGGIFGAINYYEDDWYFTNTYYFKEMSNSGQITGSGNYVGGIMGHAYIYTDGGNSWAYITDAVNSGNVSGNEYVGGVVGFFEKNTNSSFHGTGDSSGIFDSVTTGTVSATANYGDIAGQANILIQ